MSQSLTKNHVRYLQYLLYLDKHHSKCTIATNAINEQYFTAGAVVDTGVSSAMKNMVSQVCLPENAGFAKGS